MEQKSLSLNQKAWKRLKRNKAAMFGLYFILLSFFVAVFAYQLAMDNTPDANRQCLELELHKPLTAIQFLPVKKSFYSEEEPFLKDFFLGRNPLYDLIPIKSYAMKRDSMFALVYKGTDFKPEEKSFRYEQILKTNPVNIGGNSYPLEKVLADTTLRLAYYNSIRVGIWKYRITKKIFWLGTDRFGRDILSRLIVGTRVSLFVGLISVIISLFIGIVLGAIAGYFRGWIDEAIMWVINVFWSIPTLLLAMGLYVGAGSFIESKLLLIFIAVGLTMWVEVARIVRGQFILVREFEFVTAAQSLGFNDFRTIFVHILPNVLGPIIVVGCANFANAILIESGLSYIGLGIQPPAPSWGGMLSEYKDFIDSDKAYLALWPGLCIMFLVLAFNLLGNGLRDALDVKGKTE